mgnify:CR=1 FL=1
MVEEIHILTPSEGDPVITYPVLYLSNSYQILVANAKAPLSLPRTLCKMEEAVERGEKLDNTTVRKLADITIEFGTELLRDKDNFALDLLSETAPKKFLQLF